MKYCIITDNNMMTDNNVAPRALELDEMAIVDALIYIRGEQLGDIIELDFKQLQKILHRTGAWAKHKMTPLKQFEIIDRLSNEGIINMDCIVDINFINNYRSAFTPERELIKNEPELYWLHNTDWARETFQLNGHLSIEEANENHNGSIFIKMTLDDVERINNNYKATHTLELSINKNKKCLHLKIDEESPIDFASLDAAKNQYKILEHLNDAPGKTVTRNRKQLKNANINVGKKSLKTQVYSDNRTVQALAKHELLMKLSSDSITMIKNKKATLNQINELKTDLNII